MARLHRDILRTLTSDIVAGVRQPGEMLPREVDLAAEFDVSRYVARETIRAMEERGLVTVRHGRGATINEPEEWEIFDPNILVASLETERGVAILGQYLECRRVLEVEAAGFAAERAREQHKQAMRDALDRMAETVDRPAGQVTEELFHEADVSFHQALIAATGNQAMSSLVKRIHSALVLARFPLGRPKYREDRALPEHRRILDAIEAADADEARRAMSDHLDTVAGYLEEHRKGTAARAGG